MGSNIFSIFATIINIMILLAIIVAIYRGIKGYQNFIKRNKEMDKKIDDILNKLENKQDNNV
ncbi:MAG: hypothetical protein Q8936_16335 [Bacillota bacterium]|nr:hypothetical protein [Bacillota bacterium]